MTVVNIPDHLVMFSTFFETDEYYFKPNFNAFLASNVAI
jgi:hypothetical protein